MKAEERHKLKANELAAYLAQAGQTLVRHRNKLMAAMLAAVIVLGGFYLYRLRAQQRLEEAWATFRAAMASNDPRSMARVAEESAGAEPVASLARYYEGLLWLAQSEREGADRSRFFGTLKDAEKAFEAVLAPGVPYHPVATPGARLKLGQIHEDRGDFDKAAKEYDAVAQDQQADWTVSKMAQELRLNLADRRVQVVFAEPPATTRPEEFSPIVPRSGGGVESVIPLPGDEGFLPFPSTRPDFEE